jgi:hypothetical protein
LAQLSCLWNWCFGWYYNEVLKQKDMDQLIAEFLFTNNYCALPDVGTLSIKSQSADLSVAEQRISPPLSVIDFSNKVSDISSFVDFVQKKMNYDYQNAKETIHQFCKQILSLNPEEKLKIESVGTFDMNSEGIINFNASEIPHHFYPSIKVNRVIHTDARHQVRVGDSEKTNAYMHSYLKDTKVKKGNQWLMFFLVILLLSLTVLIHYLTHMNQNNEGINTKKVKTHTVESIR